jgi:hypothetical protein
MQVDRDQCAKKRKLGLVLDQQYADMEDAGRTRPRSPGDYE